MKKIISCIFISLVLYAVVQIGNAFSGDVSKLKEPIDNFEINVEEKNLKEESDESAKSAKENIEEKENKAEDKEPEKNNIKKEIQQSKNNEVNQVKETNKNAGPVIQPEQPTQKEQTITVQESNNNQNAWDSLGISEYDYYNKPAHAWAELDYKISTYGTREATLAACKSYGDAYIKENGGMYFCDSVNSYSGNYLGEDFDYIKNSN